MQPTLTPTARPLAVQHCPTRPQLYHSSRRSHFSAHGHMEAHGSPGQSGPLPVGAGSDARVRVRARPARRGEQRSPFFLMCRLILCRGLVLRHACRPYGQLPTPMHACAASGLIDTGRHFCLWQGKYVCSGLGGQRLWLWRELGVLY